MCRSIKTVSLLDSHIPLDPALQDDVNNSDIARRSTAPIIFDESNAELTYSAPNTVDSSICEENETPKFVSSRLNPYDLSWIHVISRIQLCQKSILAPTRKFASMIWKVLMMTTIRTMMMMKKTRRHQPNCVSNTHERTAYADTLSVDPISLSTAVPFQRWHQKCDLHINCPASNRHS